MSIIDPSRTGSRDLAKTASKDPLKEAKDQAKLRQAAQLFEAQFLKTLWKEMRKTVHKTGLVNGGQAEEMFTDLMDQAVSDQTSQGRSMGLADLVEHQLGRQRVKSPSLARRGNGLGLSATPEAALPSTPAAPKLNPLPGLGRYQRSSRAAEDYQLPVAGGVVSSVFGSRLHPITGEERPHKGLDLAAPQGTPVAAAKSGTVTFAGDGGEFGNLVVIEHQGGGSTRYGHLDSLLVKEGQQVSQGQEVATVGNTGLSTGAHLHFEVRDAAGQAVDPLPLVAKGLDLAG